MDFTPQKENINRRLVTLKEINGCSIFCPRKVHRVFSQLFTQVSRKY